MTMETVEDFYLSRDLVLPESLGKELGHFNVFRRRDFLKRRPGLVPAGRRDFYKIVLFAGHHIIRYPRETVETRVSSLLFAPPLVPHTWTSVEESQEGYLCVFTAAFLQKFGGPGGYSLFRPDSEHLLALTEDQTIEANRIFERMISVLDSPYPAKYDLTRVLILELIHNATMQLLPTGEKANESESATAATRVTNAFTELLERQFPLESPAQSLLVRGPSDFADHLGVHVNYLNRCLQSVTGRSTSQLITDRIALEAQSLLVYTHWNVSEIGYSLGYSTPAHFIDFFKRRFGVTPKTYRLNRLV